MLVGAVSVFVVSLCVISCGILVLFFFFFFKQKTAYEMRISDWSSDVCSSDLRLGERRDMLARDAGGGGRGVGADPRGDPRVLQAGRAADRPVRCEPYLLVAGAAVVRRAAIPCRGCRDAGERHAAGEIGRASCRASGCPYV